MGKFAIACPKCGKYAEGKTGIFARKKIECSCGNIINVKLEKLASKKCPHCGNQIVYDQTKGTDAACPVCHQKVNTLDDQQKLHAFTCKQCGISLSAASGAETFVCPVCDFENNVQERLEFEKIRKDNLPAVIKYEGDNSTFIWKHPLEDFTYGSQLIVHESQEAIFFRDGQALDLFGPGRHTLETQQLPLLEKTFRLPTENGGVFHSEVYFINKTVQMGIKWGTPEQVRFIDPLTGVPLQLGASGELNLQVADSRKLLVKLVGTMGGIAWGEGPGLTKSLQASFRPLITSAVKVSLPAVINKEAIDILEIDSKLDLISSSLLEAIRPGFDDYGLTIPQLYVTSVVLPEDDKNFQRIRELHTISLQTRTYQAQALVEAARREAELAEQTTRTEVAKREAERKVIGAQAEAEAQRAAGLAEADVMRAKGYTQRDVLQADVQKAYAEGIGNMGPVVSGGGGGGSIVGDMLGLGVGMAAASAIAPQLGGMMQGINPQMQQAAPPPAAPGTWDCACGQRGITGNFCSNCGSRRPAPAAPGTWDCACGRRGITGNFCSNCGAKRPDAGPAAWDCSCGRKGITGNFCDNCGKKRED